MTRINVVPVQELCDQHLLAEHRELTRIPNCVLKGRYKLDGNEPKDYKLGEGHVKFFLDKMMFLQRRYDNLHEECLARGFNVTNIWPKEIALFPDYFWKDYTPTENALMINRERILERMPKDARFTKRK